MSDGLDGAEGLDESDNEDAAEQDEERNGSWMIVIASRGAGQFHCRMRWQLLLVLAVFLGLGWKTGSAANNELTRQEQAAGWKLLFDGKTTQGWRSFKSNSFPAGGWAVEDGWLHCLGKNGGDIISEEEFDRFELEWEWKLAEAGNSGVKYFVPESRSSAIGHEYQLLDDDRHPDGKLGEGKRVTASFYDVLKPEVKTPTRSMGEINHSRILVAGNHVEHWLNGARVLEYECGSEAIKAAVAKSKFKSVPGFGDRVRAHILLQNHQSEVWFRNVKIRALPTEGDAAFSKLADEFVEGYLEWRPGVGTELGLHQYDGKVTDFARASLNGELKRLKTFEKRLAELEPGTLSPQTVYDYRILQGVIRREIFAFEGVQIYTRNPMTYAGAVDVNVYIKRNFASLEDRVRSVIAILSQAPKLMEAARANLEKSLPKPQVETAIDQADGAVDFLGKDLVEAVKPVKDEKLMAEFKAANQKAMQELRGYATYLREQKLPKANDHYALGRKRYMELLKSGEGVSLSPEKLLEVGMRELRAKQEAFAAAARQIDPNKKATDVFEAIQKDHPTGQSLIPDTAKDLDTIRQFVIDRKLVSISSDVRAAVTETPQYLRATSFASMETPGPFETKATEAYYYVTPPESNWSPEQTEEWLTAMNYYTTDIVSIHEAYPGHYVQFLALKASPATRLERVFGSYAFIEGWAHYTEQMMIDEGFSGADSGSGTAASSLKGAKYRLAQTDEALLRVCRLCVSIKMHCQGMTVDEATKFFQDNCYYEHKTARQEAMRGAFDPEYLYYTLGKLEILKLREDYRRQEGANFTLQRFHDKILRHGQPPIWLLRTVLMREPGEWGRVLE